MNEPLKLMCIFAHPDDESFGAGGLLAKYAAQGIQATLICATRGERGWTGNPEDYPGLEALGKLREQELRCAAQTLGLHELIFLDYIDGDLDKVDPRTIVPQLVEHLRRVRPQVVVTFDPTGVYGHPDHIALAQFTLAAVTMAAAASLGGEMSLPPHIVDKLYAVIETEPIIRAFEEIVGKQAMPVDGHERGMVSWPEWAATTRIDIREYWEPAVQALDCHRSQLPDGNPLRRLGQEYDVSVWGWINLYRTYSLVNGGRAIETDLFDGLRPQSVKVEVGT